jgi:isoleucyl-tRNA synthetase
MLHNLKNFNPSEIEEKVLRLWREKNVFQKTLKVPKGNKPKIFSFWEGPPTANARPAVHHVLARSFKDAVLRFKTMRGFLVPRKGGWDTHGLPVELQIEKELGFKNKKDIENYGIAPFNQKCKESVWVYKSEWEKLTERMGFWLDMKNPYVTYHKNYIESLWWLIKQAWDRGLMYKGHKIVNWCPRCGTGLSSHELAQGYQTDIDNSVYVKFKLRQGQKIILERSFEGKKDFVVDERTYILSWTTTPWTLPGNVACAVGGSIEYGIYKQNDSLEVYIVAVDLADAVLGKDKGKEIGRVLGKNLVGISYHPLFDIKALNKPTSYKIYEADFVTTTDGTGVVHTAVMYGEDDYNLGKSVGLVDYHTVDEQGRFTNDVKGFEGIYVKSKEADEKIFDYLKKNGNLLKVVPYTHEYPHCWRCGTALIYYARSSWFVAMSKLKDKLIESNKGVNWIPSYIKEGRYGEWIADVKDWNFSRERYWGTPLPIWECQKCGKTKVIGSYKEITSQLPSSGNTYVLLRHGQAGHNVKNVINSNPKNKDLYPLTAKGVSQAKKAAAEIKKLKIKVDAIYSSDFIRAKETAEILAKTLGIKKINFDARLREINTGEFDADNPRRYHEYYSSTEEKFMKCPPGGESLRDVASRVWDFIQSCEKKYKNAVIVLVGHEYPLWMAETIISGWSQEESVYKKELRRGDFIELGKYHIVKFEPASRDYQGICDYHRPYVDELEIKCECGANMKRVPEVADVWFDSGAMPFAQDHYPFNKGDKERKKPKLFPADYICEAVDQTRGWFYTLMAVAAWLDYKTPYKNVICLGHINDKYGKKMSKSKGNVVDPWTIANKYGIDALRWYFYSINDPGEPKNFDEDEVAKVLRKFSLTLYNSFAFLALYGKKGVNIKKEPKPSNILDEWILAKLREVVSKVAQRMDNYDFPSSARLIEGFIDDLSRWFIRRSRKRFQKVLNKSDWEKASAVLGYCLLQFSKVIAPFVPFFAEALYQSLKKICNG